MFNNIGRKIKALAQVVCWIGIITSIICGIILMTIGEGGLNLVGFLIMILGVLFSWIGSFMTYGFGQLIENTDMLVAKETDNVTEPTESIESINEKLGTLTKWKEQGLITEEEYTQKMENLK